MVRPAPLSPTPYHDVSALAPSPAGDGEVPAELDPEAERARRAHHSYSTLVVAVFVAYMAVGIGLYLWRGAYFTPDRWLILLLVGAMVMGRTLTFLRDWVPVVMLIAGYEFMRKLAGQMVAEQDRYVHYRELIEADRVLFGGHQPVLWVQDRFHEAGTVHWYDYVALLFYALHFVFPLVFAFMLWLTRKERFWQFSLTFLVMTYAAFAFFLYYPAAPPWMANRDGYIQGVEWPATQAFQALVPHRYDNFDTFKIWDEVSGNPVAAMPSLHAGFPWLVLLFAVKFYGRRGLIFLPYSPILWFSIVYLGHHWVVDILAGVAWATVCFIAVQFAWPAIMRGFGIPIPRPVRAAAARVRGAVTPRIAAVTRPIARVRARLLSLITSPFQRIKARS